MNGSDTLEPPVAEIRLASTPTRPHLLVAVVVLLVAGFAAYWNSFAGVLVFDDIQAIQDNASIRSLGNLRAVLCPPASSPMAGRPLVNLTLAVNYAIGGAEELWSYHAVNLAIHLLAALALMGVVRRTLLTAPLVERLGRAALPLATGVALVWMLHPLQTEAVTYLSQRSESLVGLLYLLTLYCAIRGAGSTKPAGWYLAAVVSCAAGMASKTVMVTAPVAVWVYDRLFLTGGWGKALARRWPLYVGLAATWAILAALAWTTPPAANLPSLGRYVATQPSVILQYLLLAVWPIPQSADYAWPWAERTVQFVPQSVIMVILLVVTVWGLVRGRVVAMAGVWFFLILLPTSSIVPMADPIFEHRLYLPLAGLAALAVIGGYGLMASSAEGKKSTGKVPPAGQALGALLVILVAACLGWLTHQRNKVYGNSVDFWRPVVDIQKLNARINTRSFRGECGLGNALIKAGQDKEGIDHLLNALRADSDRWEGHWYWASAVMAAGQHADAIGSLRRLVRLRGNWAEPYRMLGECYERVGQPNLAVDCYQKALERAPGNAAIRAALERVKGGPPTRPTSPPASRPTSPPASRATSQA
ncbi:MAG: tetratricopeptide repeat protein [Phycisphaerae bacterium]|nr:tetratricopeptide repeat protein [Phycisphaerae bacterium]